MKEFDRKGLDLAGFQGDIFEKSLTEYELSSPVFIRRFMKSELARELDTGETAFLPLNEEWAFKLLNKQYQDKKYGKVKYSPAELHWIGYIYRYICFTRKESSVFIYSQFKPEELRKVYYAYHTQSEEWVVASLLKSHNLDESFFDKNERLKECLREMMGKTR